MTIAAGFVCSDGLVIFADTEEQEGYMKTEVDKIQVYPGTELALVIANAGQGYLADALTDRIFDAVAGESSQERIISLIRSTLLDFHKKEVALYPAEDEHKQVGLIMGLQIGNDPPLLLHSASTALRKVREFAVIGYGAEIKFLAQQLYDRGMPLKHGILIANHLLQTAKDYVQGCGGESHIATVSGGDIERRDVFDVWSEKGVFSALRSNYRALLLSIPDEDITDEQFDNCMEQFVEKAWKARTEKLQERQFNKEMKEKRAEYLAKTPRTFEGHYEPIEKEFDIMDRRRKLPKYKLDRRSGNLVALKQLASLAPKK